MNRRGFLQSLGLVAGTATISSGATYGLIRPKPLPASTTPPTIGTYVQMGTSITAGLHGPGAHLIPITVGSRLNLTPINVGVDGTCAGVYERPYYDDFSLRRLVDAIVSGNWSDQDRSMPSIGNGNEPTLTRLKMVDFKKVTHIGLEYGTNDFTVCAPLSAFKESLSYSVRKLLAAFPQLHLFLMTPAWCLNFESLDSDTHPNLSGVFLREYAAAVLEVAALNHVPCLDIWRTLGTNANNYKTFTFDGTHPNETGARVRGEVIASFMKAAF